jgi:predicted dinucleotide-binding enzyme
MPAAMDPIIKQRVIAQYLQGVSRDTIAADNGIALQSAGNLSDKIVVDCTNPLKEDLSGLVIGHTSSGAEQVAEWAVGANAVMFVCGDDSSSKKIVLQLAEQRV